MTLRPGTWCRLSGQHQWRPSRGAPTVVALRGRRYVVMGDECAECPAVRNVTATLHRQLPPRPVP